MTLQTAQQRSFFDQPATTPPRPTAPFVAKSETSKTAATAIAGTSSAMRERVLGYIRGRGAVGAIDQEIAAELRMLADTARARRCELRDRGLIADSGCRRQSPSGRPATVWVARNLASDPTTVTF